MLPPASSGAAAASSSASAVRPVLVELFTSEGCSSCPPADQLLHQLDASQPVAGAEAIVLSEHVDYWNQIGWVDPYSSSFFSQRQSEYARHFDLASPYTPQMIVGGASEVLGSDPRAVEQAIRKAADRQELAVRVSGISVDHAGVLRAHLEGDPLPADAKHVGVFLAVALDHAESQVAAGENRGRHLTHTAVVISMRHAGDLEKGKSFARDVEIQLDRKRDLSNLRVIAFAQEAGPGPVLGAAFARLRR